LCESTHMVAPSMSSMQPLKRNQGAWCMPWFHIIYSFVEVHKVVVQACILLKSPQVSNTKWWVWESKRYRDRTQSKISLSHENINREENEFDRPQYVLTKSCISTRRYIISSFIKMKCNQPTYGLLCMLNMCITTYKD